MHTTTLILQIVESNKLELRYDEEEQLWFILGYTTKGKTFAETVSTFYIETGMHLDNLVSAKKQVLEYDKIYRETEKPVLALIVDIIKGLRDLRAELKDAIMSTTNIVHRMDYDSVIGDINVLLTTISVEQIGIPTKP